MKTLSIDLKMIIIAIIVAILLLFIPNMSAHADEEIKYPNGKSEADYKALESTYLGYGLNSKGTFISGGVELHSTDLYYLYDLTK